MVSIIKSSTANASNAPTLKNSSSSSSSSSSQRGGILNFATLTAFLIGFGVASIIFHERASHKLMDSMMTATTASATTKTTAITTSTQVSETSDAESSVSSSSDAIATTTVGKEGEKEEKEDETEEQRRMTDEITSSSSSSSSASSMCPTNKTQKDFYEIGKVSGTDKVGGGHRTEECRLDRNKCSNKTARRLECRVWGHYYHTLYQSWLGPYSTPEAKPFQFLEIGFFSGGGYATFNEFIPHAERHSMEISCSNLTDANGNQWTNYAKQSPHYSQILQDKRLHCGDASDVNFLHETWTRHMNRTDAPPLRVVVDDASHFSDHMAKSIFFWFPRIQPGGLMFIEDIQPIAIANKFRTDFMPQLMLDLHYCGDNVVVDEPCFPTLQPFLHSIHCELHICVLVRNDKPAEELSLQDSSMPPGALDLKSCKAMMQ